MSWLPEGVILLPGDQVLQTPCQTGDWLLHLPETDLVRVGIDPIPLNLQQARAAAARRHLRAAFLPGTSGSLPFADGSFHVILSCGALELAADPSDTLTEFARLLAPSGLLVCVALTASRARNLYEIEETPPQAIAPRPLRDWTLDDLQGWCDELGLGISASEPGPDGPWAVVGFF